MKTLRLYNQRTMKMMPVVLGVAALLAGFVLGCRATFSGSPISPEAVAGLQPGVTTRAEVEAELGRANRPLAGGRVIVYQWQTIQSGPAVQVVLMEDAEYDYGPILRTPAALRHSALALEFDASNRLIRLRSFEEEDADKLELRVAEWAQSPVPGSLR